MRRGTEVAKAVISATVDGKGINEGIVKSVEDAAPGVEKAGKDQGEQYGDRFSEGFFARMRNKFSGRGEDGAFGFNKVFGKAGSDAGTQMGDRLSKSLLARINAKGPETSARILSMMSKVEEAGARANAALRAVENDSGGDSKGLTRLIKDARRASSEFGFLEREMNKVLKAENLLTAVSRNSRKDTGLTSLDDWLSGTRSRNNFINLMARSLGFLVHGFEAAILASRKFITNMKGADEGASVFGKIMAGFGSSAAEGGGSIGSLFATIASGAPVALAAIFAIVAGASVLVSIVSALAAAIAALAATIASALVAALLVGGAGIVAMAAAGGLLVNAFTSMTDAQIKYLSNAVKPLKAEMTGIGQIMIQQMVPSFKTWSDNLQHAAVLVAPLAKVMGSAFAEAGDRLTKSLSGPGFQQFIASLTVYLPGIVTNLASALGSFLNGLLSVFSVLLPYVLQFSSYLAGAAKEFAKWASSAKGRSAIEDFVARAVSSLKSLWNFVVSVGQLVAAVLFSKSGQNAGNSIFDDMTNAIKKLTAWVSKDNNLQKWFAEGIAFAHGLGQAIKAVSDLLMSLNNTGIITALDNIATGFANISSVVGSMLKPMTGLIGLIGTVTTWLGGGGGKKPGVNGTQAQIDAFGSTMLGPIGAVAPKPKVPKSPTQSFIDSLIASGNAALNATSKKHGGNVGPAAKPKWQNPYVAWANSLINDGPTVSAQIKNAMLSLNKSAASGIREAAKAKSADSVTSAMDSLLSTLQTTGEQTVNTARTALNNAATSLANATSKGAAAAALKKVRASQKDLKAALADQKRINAAAAILSGQKVVSEAVVAQLLAGVRANNATLADYAEARSRVATRLQDANSALQAALQLRDSYKSQVADSIKSFGSLISAQAQVIDGVAQSLTAADVTANLRDKLTQIQKFQSDLRMLLAQGLSNDAYKQIVDAGVQQGTTIADALIAGGTGAIQNTNTLVGQINGIADTLGSETSSRLYQAGVDAAQGLVDGLTSLSAQLDSAAYTLGTSIANAVKKALGIASPSRVMRGMMSYVGDGMALGLEDQHTKVGTAASALASRIGVNPANTFSSTAGGAAVSGNAGAKVDLTIVTPTEDPHAVANEVINELVGRL